MFPLKVKRVLLVPLQTVLAPLILPATDTGFTAIVLLALVSAAHTPLVTITR